MIIKEINESLSGGTKDFRDKLELIRMTRIANCFMTRNGGEVFQVESHLYQGP